MKKEPKTFYPSGSRTSAGTRLPPRSADKSFLVLFFKKEPLPLICF
jgi:hypothetical protein